MAPTRRLLCSGWFPLEGAPLIITLILQISYGSEGVFAKEFSFSDNLKTGGSGPVMVTVHPGSFQMGCLSGILCDDKNWDRASMARNTPVHTVSIAGPFALSRHEITRGEFADFVERSGYVTHAELPKALGRGCSSFSSGEVGGPVGNDPLTWRRPGFMQGQDHPVVCVSWPDAKEYVRWLVKETGKQYRLPSEAEWEYAARANNTEQTYEQESWYCSLKNGLQGDRTQDLRRCFGEPGTVPVNSLAPNAFGLLGMGGNAYEFVEDCWHWDLTGAPADGSAWLTGGDCGIRIIRDGGWGRVVLHEARGGQTTAYSTNFIGFRVAQSSME